ncbi:MAG: KpsF/GutQ family sugar-phosphate isomerase [Bacteroidota bacterium]
MKNASLISKVGRQTIEIEANALQQLTASINDSFVACVNAIYEAKGRLVVTGIGKTALVAKKIVATLNSTGTPALFLHAADAIHGDIGMIREFDVVLCLSKSGETEEIKMLSTLVRHRGNKIIAMVSHPDCSLARQADHVLLTPHTREADPNDLAPTTSTTLQMALGDALATALLALRGFSPADFANFHPGGSLGKQLYLRVEDLYVHNLVPAVHPQTPLRDTLLEMTTKRLGATAVLEPGTRKLLGIITDGDLRRMLSDASDLTGVVAQDIMTKTPKTILADTLAVRALEELRKHNISQLVVIGPTGSYRGFLHLHDLIREGFV